MKLCISRGGYFSSSTFIAFISRLIADSWSPESRIWKVCGRFASRKCARSMRLHSPWNVPIHMPRVLMGSIAERRVTISFAALLVNVTARRPCGLTAPVLMRYAIRVVSTRVLPLLAAVRLSADWAVSTKEARCSGLRPESREEFMAELSHSNVELLKFHWRLLLTYNCSAGLQW